MTKNTLDDKIKELIGMKLEKLKKAVRDHVQRKKVMDITKRRTRLDDTRWHGEC